METNANYVAVGAFVLVCILGLVIALLWLAGAQYRQEFTHYQTYFSGSVTGLSKGTSVRYNGIEVGRVSRLKFDPEDPRRVIVTMEVDPTLSLHEDSVASIASMGLTGGSYVEIEGGSKDSPILKVLPGQEYAVIKSAPSTLQQLAESAPRLIAKYNQIGDEVAELLNQKNRAAVGRILANLDTTTGVLARRSDDLDATIRNLNATSRALTVTLAHADEAVVNIAKLSRDADDAIGGDVPAQLAQLVAQTRSMVTSLKDLSNSLQNRPTGLLFGDRREGYTPK